MFACLESEFLVMPKGKGFIEFPVFEHGYEALKRATGGFRDVTADTVAPAVFEDPIALVVLRCMLGFTPPEWAYYASQHTDVPVTQSAARTIDRNIRMDPEAALPKKGTVTERRIRALVAAAVLRALADETASDIELRHAETGADKVRGFADFDYAAVERAGQAIVKIMKGEDGR